MTEKPTTQLELLGWQEKYEKLKEFVRGKWTGDCAECAALANCILNKENENDM